VLVFTAVTKHLRKTTWKRKRGKIYFIMVSEVSIHGHMALLFLGHDDAELLGRGHVMAEIYSLHGS
jgi:hypothetical protein